MSGTCCKTFLLSSPDVLKHSPFDYSPIIFPAESVLGCDGYLNRRQIASNT